MSGFSRFIAIQKKDAIDDVSRLYFCSDIKEGSLNSDDELSTLIHNCISKNKQLCVENIKSIIEYQANNADNNEIIICVSLILTMYASDKTELKMEQDDLILQLFFKFIKPNMRLAISLFRIIKKWPVCSNYEFNFIKEKFDIAIMKSCENALSLNAPWDSQDHRQNIATLISMLKSYHNLIDENYCFILQKSMGAHKNILKAFIYELQKNEFFKNLPKILSRDQDVFSCVGKLICMLSQSELRLYYQEFFYSAKNETNYYSLSCFTYTEQSFELEKRTDGTKKDITCQRKLILLDQLCSPMLQKSFSDVTKRLIVQACDKLTLADSPIPIHFSGAVSQSSEATSTQFLLLLQTRYFASSTFGHFLTPCPPISNENADHTQATISTTCTSWLSAIGSAVGLPALGFPISKSVQQLIHLVVDTLLPTVLVFSMADDLGDLEVFNSHLEMITSFFSPLLTFLSGRAGTPSLTSQLVEILVGVDENDEDADAEFEPKRVHEHITRMAAAIADLLTLRGLCDLLCIVWQENSATLPTVRPHTNASSMNNYFEESVLQLTQCGKQLESAVRQLADRITDIAVDHSLLVCFQQPIKTNKDPASRNSEEISQVSIWKHFMKDVWGVFTTYCPAGLARQMQAKIASTCLLFLVQRFSNTTCQTKEESENLGKNIWIALETAHECLMESSETVNELLARTQLSVDLQNLHSSALMLVQCLIGHCAPLSILNQIHLKDFYSSLKDEEFEKSFETSNWLKIVDPKRFAYIPVTSGFLPVDDILVILRQFASSSYFDPIGAFKLIFSATGSILRVLLTSPSRFALCKPSCNDFANVISCYQSFYRILAANIENNDCYVNLLVPLFESLSELNCLSIDANFPNFNQTPAWLEALILLVCDSFASNFNHFCDLVTERVITDASFSSKSADQLLSTPQPPSQLLSSMTLARLPQPWSCAFPDKCLPCGCSIASAPTPLVLPSLDESEAGDASPIGNPNFVRECVDFVVDLLSTAHQSLPESLLVAFAQIDKILRKRLMVIVGGHLLVHLLLLSLFKKIEIVGGKDRSRRLLLFTFLLHLVESDQVNVIKSTAVNLIRSISQINKSEILPEDENTKESGRRFLLGQQLRHVQHTAFEDLFRVHQILKLNIDWLEYKFMRECGIHSTRLIEEKVQEGPVLTNDAKLFHCDIVNDCLHFSEINWTNLCNVNCGLTRKTLSQILGRRFEDCSQLISRI